MKERDFFNEYYQELEKAFESGYPSVRYNSDRAHNAVIMCFMLDHSNVMNMFCGQMSVLRTGFFDKINQKNDQNDSHLGDELRLHLRNSLDKFLNREKSKFNILFESFSSEYGSDLICPDGMKAASSNGKLKMKVLPEDLKIRNQLDHFTVSDAGMSRFEDDKEQHSAVCTFNDGAYAAQLQRNFQKLYGLDGNTIVFL